MPTIIIIINSSLYRIDDITPDPFVISVIRSDQYLINLDISLLSGIITTFLEGQTVENTVKINKHPYRILAFQSSVIYFLDQVHRIFLVGELVFTQCE